MSEITIIRNNAELTTFQNSNIDGYVIMDGDRGIGLVGSLAERARNIGGDPNSWIEFSAEIGPAIHASMK